MVKAIDFVVRDSAGGLVRGNVAGDGSNFVQMGMGEEISLNLARESIVGFAQDGGDLVITLVDGRQIVLADYFNQAGEANQLYLSQFYPPGWRLAPTEDAAQFVDEARQLQQRLDLRLQDSSDENAEGGAEDDEEE